ncbi:MAG: GlsB/YeaQ/YmgE family stress response membrane protein [Candidatus Omnitrophica bacterium CG11_big_fil_rev_8_21_14_0_20_63_9]|nr:MAG: GlsB/YeaQ/YmgE family stress response membrane protein [Candidatus Omnitrophica bacterium CG11_big_fil_rev_8_21_14_0_20_63_9]
MEHNAEYWVWFLLMGAIIGWLAGLIMKGRGFGIFGNIVVGIVGAALGGWVAGAMGLYTSSSIGAFLVALIGAVLLVALTGFIKRVAGSA